MSDSMWTRVGLDLGFEPRHVLVEIDNEALVLGLAYLLDVVEHFCFERKLAAVDRNELRFATHLFADRRRREMADIHRHPDLPLTGFQVWFRQVLRCHLDKTCHRWRRKYEILAASGAHIAGEIPHHFV